MDEKDLFAARILSVASSAEKSWDVRYTKFLSLSEQAIAEDLLLRQGYHFCFFGGRCETERKIAAVFPCEDFEYDQSGFPIEIVKISGSGYREFSNRDILGSLMSLGITRDVLGDIIVSEDRYTAFVFVCLGIGDYIISELERVANDKVVCKRCTEKDIPVILKKYEEISTTCASLRADAVLSSFLNLSRESVCRLISAGDVMINHILLEKKEKECSQGDVFSIRRYGRFILSEIGPQNRKNRTRILIKKFI